MIAFFAIKTPRDASRVTEAHPIVKSIDLEKEECYIPDSSFSRNKVPTSGLK